MEPAEKKRKFEDNLNRTARVHLAFETWLKNVIIYGTSVESNYALEQDMDFVEVQFESARELRKWGWSRDIIEKYVESMLPFVGIKLDFFKNNILKRTEYVEIQSDYTVEGINNFDRVRVKLFTPEERIVEGVSENIKSLGEESLECPDWLSCEGSDNSLE